MFKSFDSKWYLLFEQICKCINSQALLLITNKFNYFRFKVAAVYSNHDNKSGPNSKHFFLNRGPPNRSLIPPTLVSAKAVNTTSILLEWEVCSNIIIILTIINLLKYMNV